MKYMLSLPTPSLEYNKPVQIRGIPRKYRSYRGKVRSTKLHLRNESHDFESGLERDLLEVLDHDYYCHDIQVQPSINELKEPFYWEDREGKKHKSFPDVWSIFITGKIILWQVKHYKELIELQKSDLWNQEINALSLECEKKGWELRVITEREIRITRLINIKILRGVALNPPEEEINNFYQILPEIFVGKKCLSFTELLNKSIQKLKIYDKRKIKNFLLYFLYYQVITFDWERPLQKNTLIYLNNQNQIMLKPFYKEKPSLDAEIIPQEQAVSIPEQQCIEEGYKRYEIIKPLLENTNRAKIDVIERANECGYSDRTLYRWIKAFEEKGGITALFPHKSKNEGNKKGRYSEKVEEIIHILIQSFISKVQKPSVADLVIEIQNEVEKVGFQHELIKYHTIAKRIRNLPAREKLGKQGIFTRYEIPASVKGEMPTGQYPLDIIQLDHTLLDVVLVDQEHRLPIGRPWITIGIDTYSRMIFCYYLSFNPPNSLSVATALMVGILPKDNLLEKFNIKGNYSIYGLPRQISIDNAKEFDSKHLEEFCEKFRIDKQFREVKRPDHAPFVERFFGTLNGAIKSANIKGYAHPLKNRPESYNPDKDAEKGGMSLPEFEEWLLRWIVKIYHQREHTTLGKPPQEKYELGLLGEGNSFGSITKIPDTTFLKFLIMPQWQKPHVLGKEGIRWKNNYYQHNEYKEIHPILRKIRKQKRGKKPKIEFRYDPRDITYIWVYDSQMKKYYPIFISKGYLKPFIDQNPDVSVSLSEYEAILRRLRKDKKKVSSRAVSEGIKRNKELVEESTAKSKKARRKKAKYQENRPNFTKSSKKGQKIVIKKKSKNVKIDWDNIEPLPAKPIGKKWKLNE